MSAKIRILSRGYGALLWLYPPPFRAEFEAEMNEVFARSLAAAADGGKGATFRLCLRELGDWPGALRREWSSDLQARRLAAKGADMEGDGPLRLAGDASHAVGDPAPEAPAAWGLALLAAAPLLFTGLGLALSELPALEPWRRWLQFGPYLLVLLGLVVAWVRGFPRWSYPYAGYALAFTLYMSSVSTPGLTLLGHTFRRREPWGWRAWLPLGAALLAGLLLTRSLRPAARFVTGAWCDWTRFSFALYGPLPLVMWLLFDEVHPPYPAPYLALSALFLAAGAVAYMRSTTPLKRALSLLAGLTATWLVCTVGLAAYWHGRQVSRMATPFHWWGTAVPMAFAWAVVALVMLAPVMLALLQRGVRRRRTF